MHSGLLIKIPEALIVHLCQNSALLTLLKAHLRERFDTTSCFDGGLWNTSALQVFLKTKENEWFKGNGGEWFFFWIIRKIRMCRKKQNWLFQRENQRLRDQKREKERKKREEVSKWVFKKYYLNKRILFH